MSSLTTCSGQGVVTQEKGNEKECVVEDIGNKSSQRRPSNGVQSTGGLESATVHHWHDWERK